MAYDCNTPASLEIAYFVLRLLCILLIASDFLINSSEFNNGSKHKLQSQIDDIIINPG